MYSFTYHRASGLRQATNMLGKLEEPKLLAGGQSLLPAMKLRLASHPNLIDLDRVEGLSGIELKGRSLIVGAMTRHADVASSPVVQEAIPALAHLANEMATRRYAIAAPSAARSPMTIRTRTIRRRCSASAPPS